MTRPIYLDYHATTPVDPRVLEAMLPFFTECFGNPASRQHAYGWDAQKAVDVARTQVAELIGASAAEIVFTSGATESNNLAIKGVAHALRDRGDHVITVATEHKSVLDSCKRLEAQGWRVTRLGVNRDGLIDLREKMSTAGRIKRDIFSEIELRVMRVNSSYVVSAAILIGHILGKQRGAGAADEMCHPFNETFPQCLIEDGVVNGADEIAHLLRIIAVARQDRQFRDRLPLFCLHFARPLTFPVTVNPLAASHIPRQA